MSYAVLPFVSRVGRVPPRDARPDTLASRIDGDPHHDHPRFATKASTARFTSFARTTEQEKKPACNIGHSLPIVAISLSISLEAAASLRQPKQPTGALSAFVTSMNTIADRYSN